MFLRSFYSVARLVSADGQPGTLRCVAVAVASAPRLEVFVGRRSVTRAQRAMQTVSTAGQRGMRLLRYRVELVRHDFRPRVVDAGRQLTCRAYLQDDHAANSTTAKLIVRRTLWPIYTHDATQPNS